MEAINSKELWRQIPPEEKVDLITKAHTTGVMAAIFAIIIMSTLAVGLKLGWLLWGSLVMSPFVFQYAAGRAFRGLKPKTMLEHLAARSAARRYAFSNKSQDLGLIMIFKGFLEEHFDSEQLEAALEAKVEDKLHSEVWVALFNDIIIMMDESPGGARLRFAHLLNENLSISGDSPAGKSEYSSKREITLSYSHRLFGKKVFRLSSKYPAALLVFEKKALTLRQDAIMRNQKELKGLIDS
jgi:hypothetical protein